MAKLNVDTRNTSDDTKTVRPLFQGISPQLCMTIPTEARASLERLLANDSISRAPRIHSVLKFMIDALLEGRAETINEQVVGEAVFGRPTGYNPGEDNIVRVTIRHLRDRLEEFYRTDGSGEKYVLIIPKGRYVPILSSSQPQQSVPLPVVPPPPLTSTSKDPETTLTAIGTSTATVPQGIVRVLPWFLVVLLAVTVGILGSRLRRQSNPSTSMKPTSQQAGLLTLLLTNGKPTTVVVADANVQAYRMMFRKTVPLNAYISRSYLHPASDYPDSALTHGVWTYIGTSRQTTMASILVASEIQSEGFPEPIKIRYPHDLSMQDFEHGNFVFLGGPWINPWEQLFEDRLNFRIVPRPDAAWYSNIHNMKPLPSEPAVFALHEKGSSQISYVRFALLRNLSNDGYIVLLGGTTEEAVEAGARFLMSQSQMDTLLRIFKVASPEQLPSIEVVIETTGLQEVPEDYRVVAERVVN